LSDSCSCLTTIVLERWIITRNETSYPGRSRESFLVRHCSESHLSWKRRNKIMLIDVEDGVRNEPHGAILLPSPANQAAPRSAASKVTQPNDPVRTFANLDCNTVQ
jgi:hypothetical protein